MLRFCFNLASIRRTGSVACCFLNKYLLLARQRSLQYFLSVLPLSWVSHCWQILLFIGCSFENVLFLAGSDLKFLVLFLNKKPRDMVPGLSERVLL